MGTGVSKEEVLIFRYTQTNRTFLLYIDDDVCFIMVAPIEMMMLLLTIVRVMMMTTLKTVKDQFIMQTH